MHSRLTRRLLVAFIAASVLVPATAAYATGSDGAWTDQGDGGSSDAWTDGTGIGAHVSHDHSTAGTRGGGDGCRYELLGADRGQSAEEMVHAGLIPQPPEGPGNWYAKICPDGSGSIVWLPLAGPAVDPATVAQEALDRASIPGPGIHLNPDGRQYVNLETWLWVDGWRSVSATAEVGGVSVTVTARPLRVEWSMGDGGRVVCDGPGAAFDPHRSPDDQDTNCSYTFHRSSDDQPDGAYTVRATSVWHVTWTATGAGQTSGDLGLIRRSDAVAVRVSEIQAVNH
jgi:hypothetical protein